MALTDTYRTLYPNRKENTFFSTPHRTFFQTNQILGHKAVFDIYIISAVKRGSEVDPWESPR